MHQPVFQLNIWTLSLLSPSTISSSSSPPSHHHYPSSPLLSLHTSSSSLFSSSHTADPPLSLRTSSSSSPLFLSSHLSDEVLHPLFSPPLRWAPLRNKVLYFCISPAGQRETHCRQNHHLTRRRRACAFKRLILFTTAVFMLLVARKGSLEKMFLTKIWWKLKSRHPNGVKDAPKLQPGMVSTTF